MKTLMVYQVGIVISLVYGVIILELYTVETGDLVQSSTTEKTTVTSKWELVDYGDDSDE